MRYEEAKAEAERVAAATGERWFVFKDRTDTDVAAEYGPYTVLDAEDGEINFPNQDPVFTAEGD
ncbi:MAG: hypothetical protein HY093_02270 [Candidatus Liptonbacteria bacterium]|nr:hypothetical protein [Candidatus Liptonbacteria bacterium]